MNVLEVTNVNQRYENGKVIFDSFNFAIPDKEDKGQFVAIMGESGCGKSTLLRYFTGLQKPSSGTVSVNGAVINDEHTIPMVFQERSCLEHLSVLDNVALPLIIKGSSKKDAREKAMEMIKVVNLEGQENKYAKYPNLSGGQLQRVAIARSLVANPGMLMLDEPFSSLDSTTRRKMQDFLKELHGKLAELNPTFVIVTHDEREAVYLADDIYVIAANPGRVKVHIETEDVPRDSAKFAQMVTYLESQI